VVHVGGLVAIINLLILAEAGMLTDQRIVRTGYFEPVTYALGGADYPRQAICPGV
jgi:hypothetical protein